MSSPGAWTVAGFLVSIGVDKSDADSAAAALLGAGYKTEKYLLSAGSEHLEKANIPLPVIDVILRHQEEVGQQQQQLLVPPLQQQAPPPWLPQQQDEAQVHESKRKGQEEAKEDGEFI